MPLKARFRWTLEEIKAFHDRARKKAAREGYRIPRPPSVTFYKHGARIHWGMVTKSPTTPFVGGHKITAGMSIKSRLRAAFAFGNAECVWSTMVVLTWRVDPGAERVKRDLDLFRRRLAREGWTIPAWFLEFQRRGVPHYHLFLHSDCDLQRALATSDKLVPSKRWNRRTRKSDDVELWRGTTEQAICRMWIETIGAERCWRTVRYHRRGIVERLRSSDAAGRYVAKEAGKLHQKELPEGYGAVGRWWYLEKSLHPKPRETHALNVAKYPEHLPIVSRVFQKEWLGDSVPHASAPRKIPPAPRARKTRTVDHAREKKRRGSH